MLSTPTKDAQNPLTVPLILPFFSPISHLSSHFDVDFCAVPLIRSSILPQFHAESRRKQEDIKKTRAATDRNRHA